MPAPIVKRAIIPAAGLGTRLQPLTFGVAKELLPLGGHPVLVATLLEAAAAGIAELVVVSSPRKEGLPRFFDRFELCRDFAVRIIEQPTPAGVLDAVARGRAVRFSPDEVDAPVAVLFPDAIHLPDQTALCRLVSAHAQCGAAIFGLRPFTPDCLGVSAAAVQLDETLDSSGLDEARESGRPLRIVSVKPSRGAPGEILTTFGQIHTTALDEALEAHCRPDGNSARPLDDGHFLKALGDLASRGGLYGALLSGELIDVGSLPGYLDAAGRFLRGAARLRGLS